MKFLFSFFLWICASKMMVFSQLKQSKIANIAVFSPLFLDSSFDVKGYKYGKLVPPFAIQGVEYLYGAKKAMDSLQNEGVLANFYLFDSKSSLNPVGKLITGGKLDSMDLLIGSVLGNDVKLLADFALQKNIAFISATYPNESGVNNNPNFLLINSTLKTNCAGIHAFIQNKFSDQRVVVITKTGKQEERITNYFKAFETNTTKPSLGIQYVNLGVDFSDENIEKYMDSTLLTTFIVASTDVSFAKTIAQFIMKRKLQDLVNLVGLPTWEDAVEFSRKDYEGLRFYYICPMEKPKNSLANEMETSFKDKYGAKPGDNMYRGYETIYSFSKLIIKHKNNLTNNFHDNTYRIFSGYDIQPVMLDPSNMTLDFYENKKIVMMKRFNGNATQIKQ